MREDCVRRQRADVADHGEWSGGRPKCAAESRSGGPGCIAEEVRSGRCGRSGRCRRCGGWCGCWRRGWSRFWCRSRRRRWCRSRCYGGAGRSARWCRGRRGGWCRAAGCGARWGRARCLRAWSLGGRGGTARSRWRHRFGRRQSRSAGRRTVGCGCWRGGRRRRGDSPRRCFCFRFRGGLRSKMTEQPALLTGWSRLKRIRQLLKGPVPAQAPVIQPLRCWADHTGRSLADGVRG